jgi:hypothetical protein
VLPLSPNRHVLAGLDSNQRRAVIQSHVAPADRATGHQEPPEGAEPSSPVYRTGALPLSYGGVVRPRGIEPPRPLRTTGISALRVYRSATNASSRHPGSNRVTRRTKAEPQAVRGGGAAPRGFEPRSSGFRGRRLAVRPKGIEYGRRELDPQATRFELVRSASCLTPACFARDSNPEPAD